MPSLSVTTAEQLLALPRGRQRHELLAGVLRAMSPGSALHGAVALTAGRLLGNHVERHDLGTAFGAETGFVLARDPDTVRAPDASFVVRGRDDLPVRGYFDGAPDLAIEVVSPNDTFDYVEQKALQWLESGCRLVIVLDPQRHTGTIYRDLRGAQLLRGDDVVDAGEVLPGWRVPLTAFWPARGR